MEKADEKLATTDSGSIESQPNENASLQNEPSPEQLKLELSARRKIDLYLVPVMTMFYLLSYLDRTNIGNARVAGMQADLRLTDHQFQVALTVLYAPYICTELPANLVLKKIGPHIVMPSLLFLWGIVVIAQGFIRNYGGLIAIRFFLGALEGPMFPGIVLHLSGFYTRKDLSLRIAYFFSAASLSGAFSGLLAAGIVQMEGLGGKRGWEWIFILEGLFTSLFGIAGFWLVPTDPTTCRGLTQEEKDATMERLRRDNPKLQQDAVFEMSYIWKALTTPHVFFLTLVFFMGGSIFYSFALFLPSIIRQMNFSPIESQLLSVGPFAVAFVVCLLSAWVSDKYNNRGVPLVIVLSILTIGWGVFYVARSPWVSYGSFFLMVPFIYSSSPLAAAWLSNNTEPYFKKASAIAIAFMSTNAGGILSTWRFPTNEGPRFTKTTILMLIFALLSALSAVANICLLRWQQARKQRNRAQILAPYTSSESDQQKAWLDLGDNHPDFEYTY